MFSHGCLADLGYQIMLPFDERILDVSYLGVDNVPQLTLAGVFNFFPQPLHSLLKLFLKLVVVLRVHWLLGGSLLHKMG
jgi:hypothetical protein